MSLHRVRHGMCGSWLLAGLLLGLCTALGAGCSPLPGAATPLPQGPTPCEVALSLTSQPAHVAVSLDGQLKGETPLDLMLTAGDHAVRLSAQGFSERTEQVTAVCGTPLTLSVILQDDTAPIISVEPLAAQVAPDQGLKVVARAEDQGTLATLTLMLDGQVLHISEEPSLRYNIDTRALELGPHTIEVIARDDAGNESRYTSEVIVTLATIPAPTTEATLPTATLRRMVATPETIGTLPPQPTPAPTVAVAWGEISINTYAYEEALYEDSSKGHPYPLLHRDRVGAPSPKVYRTLMLGNEYLELTFLPELGGRLYQCTFLPSGQKLFYNNSVIKPSNWGPPEQGWWLAAGGLEFCLPVEEHGYLSAEPWEAEVERLPDGETIAWMSIHERTRDLDVRVGVGLAPGNSSFRVYSQIRNAGGSSQDLQYWINAMLSPGRSSVAPSLRFYYPTDTMIVHSTGDGSLPKAGEMMTWPVFQGRDLGLYGNWRNWLGLFARDLKAPYTAVYDPEVELGLVRIFPADTAHGAKLFAFGTGFGDADNYTDDGSQYVEMWGGWTPTFGEAGTLDAGETLAWTEIWYPLWHVGGVSGASDRATLYATRRGAELTVSLFPVQAVRWTLEVRAGGGRLLQRTLTCSPARPYSEALTLPEGNTTDSVSVRILDENGAVVLEQTVSP